MPVVVQLAISMRTLSKVRRSTFSVRISSVKPVASSLPASSVGKRASSSLRNVLVISRPNAGMDVGEARDERLGVAGPLEVHLGQFAADVQGVDHGAEAVEVGAGVDLAVAGHQLRGGVERAAHRGVGRQRQRQQVGQVGEPRLALRR